MNPDDVVGRAKSSFDIGIVMMVDLSLSHLTKSIILINE